MLDTCVLLIGHGSRDAQANAEFETLVDAYRAAHAELRVEAAYIELAEPLLTDALFAIAPQVRRLVVVPVLLFAAGHVKQDLPLAVDSTRRRFPAVEIVLARPLGVQQGLIELAGSRLSNALGHDAGTHAKTLLVVVGRGSSDPDANGDLCKVARMIGEGRGLLHVESSFMGITTPKFDTSLPFIARLEPEHVVVLPYMLFAGVLVSRLAKLVDEVSARYPRIRWTVTPHLGVDPRVLALLEQRVGQARSGEAPLPCDTCHYRAALTRPHSELVPAHALLAVT